MAKLKQYAAEPMAEVPEMKELIDKKIKEMAELKPTEQEISMIASAYCRLQFGIKKCSECPAFNCACNWLREKIAPLTVVAFAIDAWNKRS